MMLKLLVGLSLATTAIFGKVIIPHNNANFQQLTNCDNSEVLLKIWTIISNLLGPDGKSVIVPDADQLRYALTLIKKSLEQHSIAQNYEVSKKLKALETELVHNKKIILNDQRPLRTLLDTDPGKNDLSSNMLSSYVLPNNIKPRCKEAFLNLIQVAQEGYVNIAKSPVCNDVNADSLVQSPSGFTYYVPTGQLHQNPYNSALISNAGTPREDALKKVSEYLQAPENYNSNNVMSLLEGFQPKAYLNSPLNSGLNPYSQPQIHNDLNVDHTAAPDNIPNINSNDGNNAANFNSPLQGDFNVNLAHAKDIADKLNGQNNHYVNQIPDSTAANIFQSNPQPTKGVYTSHFPDGGVGVNSPPKNQISFTDIQKLMDYIPVKNGNYANLQNYLGSPHNLYKPSQYGNYYFNPNQNKDHLIGSMKKLKIKQPPQNLGDNINHNYFNQAGLNNPGDFNHNIYQYALPYQQSPLSNQFAINSNNILAPHKQMTNDFNSVVNSAKLETNITPRGEVELTYLLKRKRPLIYQPFYFVKYRLPYNYFVQNLRQMLSLTPHLITPPTELYKGLIAPSNATEVSPDLATYPKEEIHSLVLKDGALVKATYIQPNGTEYNDTTVDSEKDSSEVNFAGDNIVVQDGIRSESANGLNSYQNLLNNKASLNPVEQNPPYLVVNQVPTAHEILPYKVGKQGALNQNSSAYETRIPLRQENQSLIKLLSALGLENLLLKESSQVNEPLKVGNQDLFHQETALHNVGYQDTPNIVNHLPGINQQNSPYKKEIQAVSSPASLPYFADNQAFSGQVGPPYNVGNQDALTQKSPQYVQETQMQKIGNQFARPPFLIGNTNKPLLIQASPPYVLENQAVLGKRNRFLGSNLFSNSLRTLSQSRSLINGYGLDPNQYVGYYGLGSYPTGLASPYSGLLGNQGPLGQAGYLGNNVLPNGIPQSYWYTNQRLMYG